MPTNRNAHLLGNAAFRIKVRRRVDISRPQVCSVAAKRSQIPYRHTARATCGSATAAAPSASLLLSGKLVHRRAARCRAVGARGETHSCSVSYVGTSDCSDRTDRLEARGQAPLADPPGSAPHEGKYAREVARRHSLGRFVRAVVCRQKPGFAAKGRPRETWKWPIRIPPGVCFSRFDVMYVRLA